MDSGMSSAEKAKKIPIKLNIFKSDSHFFDLIKSQE